jgi:hypothetical protein
VTRNAIVGTLVAASAAVLVIALADHGSAAGAQFEQVPSPAQEEGGRAGGVLGPTRSPGGAEASGGRDADQSIRADGETVSITGELVIPTLALALLLAAGVVALRGRPAG